MHDDDDYGEYYDGEADDEVVTTTQATNFRYFYFDDEFYFFVGLILLPVHNLQFCRFRWSLRVPPTQPLDQRRVINPTGERS
jgi:hypothetical protein